MPLAIEEIVPGAVAILESGPLLGNPDVIHAADQEPFRRGPFLCISVADGKSQWRYLTSRRDDRGLRLEILPEWRMEGSAIWRNTPQYIGDARKPFSGPHECFVAAGANELPHRPHNRPQVSADGVAAAVAEMGRYGVSAL